ncbi:ATP-binding protein, partial [Calothrix sp. CCY 0018]|uniref:ATP-binding protein n=1 Tax=Calothrix sp. CCY 0018 TaxID=3103864 RepID=UPI0039C75AFE
CTFVNSYFSSYPDLLSGYFFTTKEVGKGTGLGLSISHQIVVEKHGGQLKCNSVLGEGTEFMIVLPIGSLYGR